MKRKQTEIGTALLILRTIRGWKQGDLAEAAGVSHTTISEYERGRRVPGTDTTLRILDVMGFDMAMFDHARVAVRLIQGAKRQGKPKGLEKNKGGC